MPAVSPSSKTVRVAAGNVARSFDRHAQSYDKLVGANPGYHDHLRLSTQRMGLPNRGADPPSLRIVRIRHRSLAESLSSLILFARGWRYSK